MQQNKTATAETIIGREDTVNLDGAKQNTKRNLIKKLLTLQEEEIQDKKEVEESKEENIRFPPKRYKKNKI